jgi:hypothetical protein
LVLAEEGLVLLVWIALVNGIGFTGLSKELKKFN